MAVLVVVIFHAFPKAMHGGFVGVDIFFVISGYLITAIILKAQSGEGFSLLEFYSRRIKRIFPALIVVLLFCLLAGWFVLLASEYRMLGKHVAAGAAYISNIVLMNEAGYFDVASESKPLLHLWSLGIEEQFYLLWPLLLMLALRWNLNPFMVIFLSMALSFLLNTANIEQHATKVFYLPISRAWELLVGAMLAYLNLYQRGAFERLAAPLLLRDPQRNPRDLANVLAWAGLVLILLAVFGLNKGKVFPGWWATLPTLGAVFIIAAGEQSWLNRRVLSSRIAVWLGVISYPLYLWHWPLLSLAHLIENGQPARGVRAALLLFSVLLAWLTYRLVEKQLRFRTQRIVPIGLFLLLVLTGAAGRHIQNQHGYVQRYPSLEVKVKAQYVEASQPSCLDQFFGNRGSQFCLINTTKTPADTVLLGDSTANHFYLGLARFYQQKQHNLLNLGVPTCPVLAGVKVWAKFQGNLCSEVTDKILETIIRTNSIHTVILSMLGAAYVNEKDGGAYELRSLTHPELRKHEAILEQGLRDTLNDLLAANKQVIFILGVPAMQGFDPASCVDIRPWRMTPAHLQTPCATPQNKVVDFERAYREMVSRVLHDFPMVQVWDAGKALCDGKLCWAMKDGKLLYRDAVHLNETGSHWMAAYFAQHLAKSAPP